MKVLTFCRAVLLLLIALAPLASNAAKQSVKVIGRDLVFVVPDGYCPLGSSPIEKALWEMQSKQSSLAGELAHLAVPCDELKLLHDGKVDGFNRWVQVLALKDKGVVGAVDVPRALFVKAISGKAKATPPDMAALSKRVNDHLDRSGYGAEIVSPQITPMGATADAFFFEMTMTATADTTSVPLVAVGAVTLANKVPLGVYAYAKAGSKGTTPVKILQTYLDGIVKSNP